MVDSPSSTGPFLTAEEFARLPEDGYRTELVRGLVVREPPAGFYHGALAVRIASLLDRFVRARGLGIVLGAETGFVLCQNPATVRAPDAAFVATARVPQDQEGYARLAPDLAVEIVSPSNTRTEIDGKVRDYLDAGTRLVWVVEPRTRTVTAYPAGAGARVHSVTDMLDGADVLPGLQLSVQHIFGNEG